MRQNCTEYNVPNHLINTQLNEETKNQASNRRIYRVLDRLYSLILCGSPCVLSIFWDNKNNLDVSVNLSTAAFLATL